jgi:hypothetical protein
LIPCQTCLFLFKAIHRSKHLTVTERSKSCYAYVHTNDADCGVFWLLNFTLGLNAGLTFATFLGDGNIFGRA